MGSAQNSRWIDFTRFRKLEYSRSLICYWHISPVDCVALFYLYFFVCNVTVLLILMFIYGIRVQIPTSQINGPDNDKLLYRANDLHYK